MLKHLPVDLKAAFAVAVIIAVMLMLTYCTVINNGLAEFS